MDRELVVVAESLAMEYPRLPRTAVVHVLTDCVAEFPGKDAHFVLAAARARLSKLAAPRRARTSDPLEVSLCDEEQHGEVQLLMELMVAASESDVPLRQDETDRLLGL